MLSKKRLAPFAVIAISTIALSACGSSGSSKSGGGSTPAVPGSASASASSSAKTSTAAFAPAKTSQGGTITYALDQAPDNFNVNTTDGNALETSQIVHGFLPSSAVGTPNAGYAFDTSLYSSPPQLTSSSPETIVYHINPAAKWSDGVPIDATDFKYLADALSGKDPKYNAASTTGYDQIQSLTGSDGGKTVTVVFATSFSEWQGLFASAGGNFLLPAHLLASQGSAGFNNAMASGPLKDAKGAYVSGGPYQVSNYTANDSLTEVPNPMWWGPKAPLDKVIFRFIEDTTQLPAALNTNEVDLIFPSGPTSDEVQQISKISRISATSLPGLEFEHIDFNFKNKFLSDPAVRKAIATAINRTQLIAATVGQVAPDTKPLGNRIYTPSQPQYQDHSGSFGKGDVTAAKQLLTSDGYTMGSDGYFKAKDGSQLSVKITAKNGSALRVSEEQVMQAQLKLAGINLVMANTDKSIGTFTAAHDYDIALFAWVGGPFVISGNAPIYITATANSENTQFYSNPKTDALFKSAQGELDPAKAASEANQADQQLWDDMATFPLFQRPSYIAVDKKFANVVANPTQDGPAWNLGEWGVKAQ